MSAVDDSLFVDFATYKKCFLPALKAQDVTEFHALFYRKNSRGIEIFFSWNIYGIKTFLAYKELEALYADTRMNIAEVVLSEGDTDPIIKLFLHEYLLDRGIPIAEER